MIIKLNNIVEYKVKVFFFFFLLQIHPFFLNVGLYRKKKKEHATYDIRDSYYTPVAPALCWCKPPGSAPSHRAGLEPGFPACEARALTRNAKGYSDPRAPFFEVRRVRFTHRLYWHTHLLHWHPTVGINAPPEWQTFFFVVFCDFLCPVCVFFPRCRSHWLIQAIKSVIRV